MMIAIGGLVLAVGFWFVIGLALYVIVGSARRELELQRHLTLASEATHATRDWRSKPEFDRYVLYERMLVPDEDPDAP